MKLLNFKRKLVLAPLYVLNGTNRGKYLKSMRYFYRQGSNCRFYIKDFGTEPYLISFGDNVELASGVRLVTHNDAVSVFRKFALVKIDDVGIIEFGNNIFVGAGAIILPGTKVEDNVIIAAGAVVKGLVKNGSVVGGIPAKHIGNISDWLDKRIEASKNYSWLDNKNNIRTERIKHFWE